MRLDLAMPENFGPEIRRAIVIVHGGEYVARLQAAGAADLTYLRIEGGDHDVA